MSDVILMRSQVEERADPNPWALQEELSAEIDPESMADTAAAYLT
ncbi:hypothetical protein ACL02R_18185 [Streptomyces sp. MS19]